MKTWFCILLMLPLLGQAQRLKKRLGYTAELISKMQYGEAETQLSRIISRDKGIHEAYYQRSICYFYSSLPQKALTDIKKAVVLDGENADYLAFLGTVQLEMGLPTEAQKSWNTALAFDPSNTKAHIALADYFIDNDVFDKALMHLNKVDANDKESSDWYYRMGVAHQGLHEIDKAIPFYQKCLKRNRLDEMALYHLSLCYYTIKEWDSCKTSLSKLILMRPSEPEFYFMKGQCSEKLGAPLQATGDYRKALALDPKNKEYQAALKRMELTD